MENWKNNNIQFPRLLAELSYVGLTNEQYNELKISMDLTQCEIDEIFERAEIQWQKIKAR